MAKPQKETQPAEPLGIEPEATAPAAPPAGPEFAKQNAIIICPYCKIQCKAGRTEAFFTRYYCPNENCPGNFSHKEARPRMADRIRAAEDLGQDYSAR